MRVFQIEGDWGFDNLKLSDRPAPEPGPGEVLIEMRMASLNSVEFQVAMPAASRGRVPA